MGKSWKFLIRKISTAVSYTHLEKKTVPKKVIKTVYRQMAFPAKMLESQADIDAYVERMRRYLTDMLRDCDGIKLN